MHKLPPDQYPLPPEYQAAYDRSDALVFETDIGAMQEPAFQARMAELSALPAGTTLKLLLDASVHDVEIAKHYVDMLQVLDEKTKNNLTDEEFSYYASESVLPSNARNLSLRPGRVAFARVVLALP